MDKKCPIYRVASLIGRKWSLLILMELYKGEKWKRYSHIKQKIPGITAKMLSTRLKELKSEGMLKKRIDTSTFPIKSEYALTEKGEDFTKAIKCMRDWGIKWNVKNSVCSMKNCKNCRL